MTLPVGGISLRIETSGVARGRDEFKQAAQQIRADARGVAAQFDDIRAQAEAAAEALRKWRVPSEDMGQALRQMGFDAQTVTATLNQNTATVDKTARTATAASPAVNKLNAALQALGLSAAGVPGPIGQVVRAVSSLGLGAGGAAVAAVAGIAAFVAAVRQMREDAIKARKPIEDLLAKAKEYAELNKTPAQARLDLAGEAANAANLARQQEKVITQLERQLAALEELRSRAKEIEDENALGNAIALLIPQITKAKIEYDQLLQAADASAKRVTKVNEDHDRAVAEIRVIELQAAAIAAEIRGADTDLQRRLRLDIGRLQIEQQVKAAKDLTDAERERLRVALLNKLALEDQLDRLEKQRRAYLLYAETLRRFNQDFAAGGASVVDAQGNKVQSSVPTTPAVEQFERALERFNAAGLTLIDTAGLLGGQIRKIGEESGRQTERIEERIAAEAKLRAQQADAADAIASLAAQIVGLDGAAVSGAQGVIDIVAALAEVRKFGSSAGTEGASLLSQIPTILGGVGAIASLFASFLSNDQARLIAQAKLEFDDALRGFQEIGREVSSLEASFRSLAESLGEAAVKALGVGGFVGGTALEVDTPEEIRATIAELRRIAATTKALREEANAAIAALEKLLAANEENRRRLEEQARQELGRFQEDLAVRRLVAEGRDEEANALRRSLEVQREILDLRKRFGDLFTEEIEAEIRRIRALEEETAAVRAANEEAQRRAEITQTLTLRELNARAALGENVAAEIRAAEQQAEIEAAIRQGYTESEIARLRYIHGLEDEAVALAEAAAAIEEALRIFEFNRDLEEDLRLRFLRATNDPGAGDYEREIRNRREIDRLIAEGASQANIEFARMVQSLEAVSDALAEANKAAEEAARLAREVAEAQADLNARDLRSRGLGDAGDDVAFFDRQRRERQDAIDRGYGQDYLADLDRVQRQEREQREAERRARQQDEFDRQFSITAPSFVGDSNATVSLGVGVAGAQIDRLSGVSQSMFVLQAKYLPLLSELVTHTELLRRIAGQPASADQSVTDARAVGQLPVI